MSVFRSRTRSSAGARPKPPVPSSSDAAPPPDSEDNASKRPKLSFSDIASMFIRLRRFSLRAGVRPARERSGSAASVVEAEATTEATTTTTTRPTTPPRNRTLSSGSKLPSPMSSPPTSRPYRKVRKPLSRLSSGSYSSSPKPLKAKPHHIICTSGDEPITHPALTNTFDEAYTGDVIRFGDVYECRGAVDIARLLKATRKAMMDQVMCSASGANVLAEEQWQSKICGPKQDKYRVEIEYWAVPKRSSLHDAHQPIALDRVKGVPGVMYIIQRRSLYY